MKHETPAGRARRAEFEWSSGTPFLGALLNGRALVVQVVPRDDVSDDRQRTAAAEGCIRWRWRRTRPFRSAANSGDIAETPW